MTRFAAVLTVVVLSSPAVRADEKADDWKKLAGAWKVVAATFNGEDSTAIFKEAVLTIEEGKYKVAFGAMTDTGTLALDPDKKPRQMTITGTEGPNKGKAMPAIYEIDGDTLKVCYNLESKDPPKEFKSTAEN